MARPRKPVAQKKLEGTFRPDRHEPAPGLHRRPTRPRPFVYGLVKDWNRVCDDLESVGALRAHHGETIWALCEALGELVTLAKLAKKGKVLVSSVRRAALEMQVRQYLHSLNLSQAKPTEAPPKPKTNPFEALKSGKVVEIA